MANTTQQPHDSTERLLAPGELLAQRTVSCLSSLMIIQLIPNCLSDVRYHRKNPFLPGKIWRDWDRRGGCGNMGTRSHHGGEVTAQSIQCCFPRGNHF